MPKEVKNKKQQLAIKVPNRDQKMKEILLKGGYVSQKDMAQAEKSSKTLRIPVTEHLVLKGIINKDILGQAVAEAFKISYADLNTKAPSRNQVLKIPESIAKKFRVVLFAVQKKGLTITSDNPGQRGLIAALKKIFPTKKILIAYSLPEDIDAIFVHYRKALKTRFARIIKAQKSIAPEIIGEIIGDALVYRASDIHFEPQEKEVVVRFRVDGVLNEAGRISKEHYENILNRIKVQSRLRIDEHFSAQDGPMRINRNGRVVDMRVSVIPTLDGEKIAIRVLAEYIRGLSLGDLGLSAKNQVALEKSSKKPFGMILVTGPTGSGKTTTLYAILRILNRPEVNIMTIEDPVEYKIVGVNQIQANPQADLTFAKGLRSIVRQDPDIILVGEIRDKETSEIAVNAALTGHLMLSTFHANDAPTSIPRLLDMGVEPFLLASTLEIILAQRLIRKICNHCRHSVSVTPVELKNKYPEAVRFFWGKKVTVYKGKGCESCGHTGYSGRTGIFEVIHITPEMKELILTNPSTLQIWNLARKQGAQALFEDGIEKVKNGITTLKELMRVATPPEKVLGLMNQSSSKRRVNIKG